MPSSNAVVARTPVSPSVKNPIIPGLAGYIGTGMLMQKAPTSSNGIASHGNDELVKKHRRSTSPPAVSVTATVPPSVVQQQHRQHPIFDEIDEEDVEGGGNGSASRSADDEADAERGLPLRRYCTKNYGGVQLCINIYMYTLSSSPCTPLLSDSTHY